MLMSVIEGALSVPAYPELVGKRVLVAGVTRRSGIDIARAFAERRARVVLQFAEASAAMQAVAEVVAPDALETKVYGPIGRGDDAVRFAKSAVQAFGGLAPARRAEGPDGVDQVRNVDDAPGVLGDGPPEVFQAELDRLRPAQTGELSRRQSAHLVGDPVVRLILRDRRQARLEGCGRDRRFAGGIQALASQAESQSSLFLGEASRLDDPDEGAFQVSPQRQEGAIGGLVDRRRMREIPSREQRAQGRRIPQIAQGAYQRKDETVVGAST